MGANFNHKHQLQLFAPCNRLEVIAIEILGSLPRTKSGNTFVVIITAR